MKYTGSKNRLSKELIPIIQSYIDNMENCKGYLEPFVGGANVIDKINCDKRIGCDSNEYLIELLKSLSSGWTPPINIDKDLYNDIRFNTSNYEKRLVGYAATQLSFGSVWFGSYRRDNTGKRDYSLEAYNNVMKQAPNLKNIHFLNMSFLDIPKEKINGYVIYCDPPYRDTYQYKTSSFPYGKYYEWVKEMSKNNIVLCSEYNMPEEFECIWHKKLKVHLNNSETGKENNEKVEKLFIYKGDNK